MSQLVVTLVSYLFYIQSTIRSWFKFIEAPAIADLLFLKDSNQRIRVRHTHDNYQLLVDSAKEDPSEVPVVSKKQLPSFLVDNTVIVLDSVVSGTGRSDAKNLYKKVLQPIFELLGIEHQYVSTTSADSIGDFATSLSANTKTTVIFISGDSSISEFVNGLSSVERGDVTVFPIPLGTGNSLALSLGLVDPLESIQRLLTPTKEPAPLNLYEVKFPRGSHYYVQDVKAKEIVEPVKFLVVLSWGFHASLVADSDTPELRKNGLDRFKVAAFANLQRRQQYDATFSINDRIVEGPFAYWVLTSTNKFEPTFEISPQGDVFKDNLYLVSFETEDDSSGKYILDIMNEVYDKGKHVNNPKVLYEKISVGDKLVLEITKSGDKSKRRFCLDGNIVVLPETENSELQVQLGGNTHKGWSLYIAH